MITLIANPEMLAILGQTKDVAEILDGAGNVLGVYTPAKTGQNGKSLFRPADPNKLYTTKDLFEHLLTMTTDEKVREGLQKRIAILAEEELCTTR